ncbi:aminoacetone oxidase family FAD-binding enzyme [Patescibacteria group bacterium]|nr:aminoacetone oxidase family FAD-binding enzyme [Patescibacteria group bacterium]
MKIAIIGGGAAGLMAAATIVETNPEAEVFLIEKNDGLGKKVIISGGGRCNVTTGITDIPTVLMRYPRGGKFLSSAMHQFSPEKVYAWFESHGVPLKVEDDLRVFPQSDSGKDIVGVFEQMFERSTVHVMLKAQATNIQKGDDGFIVTLKDQNKPLHVDAVILTTGGQAFRQTGSTGDGYAFAQSLGHTITKLAPSLNSFGTLETWTADVSGVSFQKAKITAVGEKRYSITGPFLFTHKGVSGPAVFALSSLVAHEEYDAAHPLEIFIDLFPNLTVDELRKEIEASIATNAKKSFENSLTAIISKSLSEVVCRELGHHISKKGGDMKKTELIACAEWLKGIPLHVISRGAGDEFVTAGGVELSEVNPSTMESTICPGLYFAGEILNIDAFTGGFNLQGSWATGRLAGLNAALE